MVSPDQTWDDLHTTLPVKEFQTGFSSWSVKALGEHLQARLQDHDSEEYKHAEHTTITVLDERSVRDRTIVLGKYTGEKREIPEDPDYADPPEWQFVRVRIHDVRDTVACAVMKSFLVFGEDSMHCVNADGIYTPPVSETSPRVACVAQADSHTTGSGFIDPRVRIESVARCHL